MLTVTTAQMNLWIAAFIWPLTRILGLIAAAPLFGNVSVPATIKIAFGALLALMVAPNLHDFPTVDPMSMAGLLILAQQLVIGLSMGFAMRIVFAGVEMAGEVIGLTMGLGFATFFDPQSQGRSSAISQFLSLLILMLYLAANVHLMMIAALFDSFNTLPIAAGPLGAHSMQKLATWGGIIFSAGVQLSLPIVAALLITNAALGILTRAAPQLNIFGIGFPIALGAGFIMISLALPYLASPFGRLLQDGIDQIHQITTIPT
ncbi:MAG: flagellar biosynthetic protein FliR, partial [Burkholderiaceae bacterium]